MGFVTVCNLVVIEICLVCLLLGWMIVLCAVLVFLQLLIPWRKGWCVFLLLPLPFPFLSLCVSSVVSTSRSSSESALLIDSSFCGFLWALVRLLLNRMFGFWPRKFFGFLKLVFESCLAAGCLCCSCGYPLLCLFSVGGARFCRTFLCVWLL